MTATTTTATRKRSHSCMEREASSQDFSARVADTANTHSTFTHSTVSDMSIDVSMCNQAENSMISFSDADHLVTPRAEQLQDAANEKVHASQSGAHGIIGGQEFLQKHNYSHDAVVQNDTTTPPLKRRRHSPMNLLQDDEKGNQIAITDANGSRVKRFVLDFVNPVKGRDETQLDEGISSFAAAKPILVSQDSSSTSNVNSEEEDYQLDILKSLNQRAAQQVAHYSNSIPRNLRNWISPVAGCSERCQLYEWLVHFSYDYPREVCDCGVDVKRRICQSTVQLTIEYLDRFFLSYEGDYPNQQTMVQLAMAAFRLAAKYQERDDMVYKLETDLLNYLDNDQMQFGPEVLNIHEDSILNALEWNLGGVVPHTLAESYLEMIRVHGISDLLLADYWKQFESRTYELLHFKYTKESLSQVPNSSFTSCCILFSRLLTLRDICFPNNACTSATDMIKLLGENRVWPSKWSELVGSSIDEMRDLLLFIEHAWETRETE